MKEFFQVCAPQTIVRNYYLVNSKPIYIDLVRFELAGLSNEAPILLHEGLF